MVGAFAMAKPYLFELRNYIHIFLEIILNSSIESISLLCYVARAYITTFTRFSKIRLRLLQQRIKRKDGEMVQLACFLGLLLQLLLGIVFNTCLFQYMDSFCFCLLSSFPLVLPTGGWLNAYLPFYHHVFMVLLLYLYLVVGWALMM